MSNNNVRDINARIFLIMIGIFALHSLCFSTSLTLNCDKAYAGGAITIPSSAYDTIKFSNGISFVSFRTRSIMIEPTLEAYGLSIDSSAGLKKAGFKYSQSATREPLPQSPRITFYSSSDTNWALSKTYPDSLVRLDSLFGDYFNPQLKKSGKWLYCTYPDPNQYFGPWSYRIPNFNNIIFTDAGQNKMKFQVSSININFVFNPFPNTQVDSLRLLWACDSLGNGIFKETTAIKTIKPPAGKTRTPVPNKLMNSRNLNFLQAPGERISFFDIKGRQRYGISQKTNFFPGGVYIYKIDGNTASSLGKMIVK